MHMNLALADTPRDLHGYGYYEGMGTGWNSETRVQTRTRTIPVPYNKLAIYYIDDHDTNILLMMLFGHVF